MKVLVTGGAGFIGSHTVDLLLQKGFQVRVLDNLDPQVHTDGVPVNILNHIDQGKVEWILGDVRDRPTMTSALRGCDAVLHLAAVVGVGQSMYEIHHYMDHNVSGTAMLLDCIVKEEVPIQRIVIASSMSIYGEGAYMDSAGKVLYPGPRPDEQLSGGCWEILDSCGQPATPLLTSEEKPLHCTSVYALSKRMQEEMLLLFGATYRIPCIALRYFNTFGSNWTLDKLDVEQSSDLHFNKICGIIGTL